MGKTDVGNTNSNLEQSESKTDRTKTTGTGSGSGTGTGTGSGSGSGSGSSKGIKTEKDSKVSVLSDLPEVNIPEPQQPKQKRKYTKKAKEEKPQSFNAEQITSLIVAVSSMVASREGCSHWLISESEAKQIAEPLSNIIEKSEHLKSFGEHADAFALVTACMMIFAPRLIMTMQISKKKKEIKRNANQSSGTNNNRKSTPRNSGSIEKTQHSANVTDVPQSILGEIPSIM